MMGMPSVRSKPLEAWLESHNAVAVCDGKLGNSKLRAYSVAGAMVVVMVPADGSGWELLMPPCADNSISTTLAAAEALLHINRAA